MSFHTFSYALLSTSLKIHCDLCMLLIHIISNLFSFADCKYDPTALIPLWHLGLLFLSLFQHLKQGGSYN